MKSRSKIQDQDLMFQYETHFLKTGTPADSDTEPTTDAWECYRHIIGRRVRTSRRVLCMRHRIILPS